MRQYMNKSRLLYYFIELYTYIVGLVFCSSKNISKTHEKHENHENNETLAGYSPWKFPQLMVRSLLASIIGLSVAELSSTARIERTNLMESSATPWTVGTQRKV